MTITKFWTITASNTTHCNDRSARHHSLESALFAASKRLESDPHNPIIIMEAVGVVTPKQIQMPINFEKI